MCIVCVYVVYVSVSFWYAIFGKYILFVKLDLLEKSQSPIQTIEAITEIIAFHNLRDLSKEWSIYYTNTEDFWLL